MKRRQGLTIVELLVTISTIVVLIAILVPTLNRVRQYGRTILNMRNQRSVVLAVTLFANDHQEQYPPSIARCYKFALDTFYWEDPRYMRTCFPLPRMEHASISGYLSPYLDQADIFNCPSAPEPHPHWQAAWQAGDQWDHPDTHVDQDRLMGTYGFYWNYRGVWDKPRAPFIGPTSLNSGPGESNILISDYLGFGNWRAANAWSSCEPGPQAWIAQGTEVSSAIWAYESPSPPPIRIHTGYTDGRVTRHRPADLHPMHVSSDPYGSQPHYNSWQPRGLFYLPRPIVSTSPDLRD